MQNFSCSGDSSLQHECNLKQLLGSTDHPVPGHLNIAPPCVCVGVGPCGILPRRCNSRPRSFSARLSCSPALCDKPVETWAARLWAVLPIGHARTTQLTGQHRMENDSALTAGTCDNRDGSSLDTNRAANKRLWKSQSQHSGRYGFPFVSHFMSRCSLMLTALVLSSGGLVSVFCSFFSF